MTELDLITLTKEYSPFIALVIFVLWESKKREEKYQERENQFIEETRKREQLYIEREERYISVIEKLSDSFEQIQKDVTDIKERLVVMNVYEKH